MDQHRSALPQVLFSGNTQGMDFFVREDGISYQFARWDGPNEPLNARHRTLAEDLQQGSIEVHRVDLDWLDVRSDIRVEKSSPFPGYTNHYDVPEGAGPALHVLDYERITLHGVWSGVDLELFSRHGILESDWVVAEPADHRLIRFEVRGAELEVDAEGQLRMTTPMGTISEGRIQADQAGRPVEAEWKVEGQTVSIRVPHYERGVPLRIDPPTRVWGTYTGGSGFDTAFDMVLDGAGGIYAAGATGSAFMATGGVHQTVNGGGNSTAYLARFSGEGERVWATYYGGPEGDAAFACATTPDGNVYLCGWTDSSVLIATPGTHQENKAGTTTDAFIALFNDAGLRVWGTYFGGTWFDQINDCATDAQGMVYVTGETTSEDGISTPDGHQVNSGAPGHDWDAFLAKFDMNGSRVWGTYFGGPSSEEGFACAVDPSGNVLLSGQTRSSTQISSAGAFQEELGGGQSLDVFLAKFTSSGIREWSTYVGGADSEYTAFCSANASGEIFLVASTASDSLATPDAHQEETQGETDILIVKFNSEGQRVWSSYYGGENSDDPLHCSVDTNGDLLLCGGTYSQSGIATAGAHDTQYTGQLDAFLAKFDTNGGLLWGTYYGGLLNEAFYACMSDHRDSIFVAGYTGSSTSISTPGAFQTTYGGGLNDMMLVRFSDCTPFTTSLVAGSTSICTPDSIDLLASGALTYVWQAAPGLTLVEGDSAVVVPPSTTTYTVIGLNDEGCPNAASVTIEVLGPDITVELDQGTLTAIQDNATYAWLDCATGALVVNADEQQFSPEVSGSYAAVISVNGCMDTTSCIDVTVVSTSVVAFGNDLLHLHPNPTNGSVQVDCGTSMVTSYTLYDTQGRCIRRADVKSNRFRIELDQLQTGTYILQMHLASGTVSARLVRE